MTPLLQELVSKFEREKECREKGWVEESEKKFAEKNPNFVKDLLKKWNEQYGKDKTTS